jgi:hypothetical protein
LSESACAPSHQASAASASHNLDISERNKRGRFLKKTESGNNWIEVSTAEAMEKASHALRGLPRRSDLGNSRSCANSTSVVASVVASSPVVSSSSTSCSFNWEKDARNTFVGQTKLSTRPMKKQRCSNSGLQHQASWTTATGEAGTAAGTTSSQMDSASNFDGNANSWTTRYPALDALRSQSFPTTFQDSFLLAFSTPKRLWIR